MSPTIRKNILTNTSFVVVCQLKAFLTVACEGAIYVDTKLVAVVCSQFTFIDI